jgi:uncharacterized protein YjiS (DUF1127 family)
MLRWSSNRQMEITLAHRRNGRSATSSDSHSIVQLSATTNPALARGNAFAIAEAILSLGEKLLKIVGMWRRRARSRRALLRLDNRTLSDIRLTRVDAEHEARKPFWRE